MYAIYPGRALLPKGGFALQLVPDVIGILCLHLANVLAGGPPEEYPGYAVGVVGAPATQPIDALSDGDRALFNAAITASSNAYAPHSKLLVGAAIRTKAGRRFIGCNVENASYGLTICAERNAVFAAVASEGPDMRIEDIAVYADADSAAPCGACRQVLAEFGSDARVLFSSHGGVRIVTVAELLPFPFEPSTRRDHR